MRSILDIAVKDFNLVVRNKGEAFFTFIFPVLIAVMFGFMMGGKGQDKATGLNLAIVDLDKSPSATGFIQGLAADGAFSLSKIETREAAMVAVRKGAMNGAVVIPQGYHEKTMAVFSGARAQIEVITDPGRWAEGGILAGKIYEHAFRQVGKTLTDGSLFSGALENAKKSVADSTALPEASKGLLTRLFASVDAVRAAGMKIPGGEDINEQRMQEKGGALNEADDVAFPGWSPIDVKSTALDDTLKVPLNRFAITLAQGVVWGLLGCMVAFAVSLAQETQRGTMRRLSAAPISPMHVLAGKAVCCFVACIIVQLLILGTMRFLGVRVTDAGQMTAAVVLCAFAFAGLMALLAGVTRTVESASGLGRGVAILLALIGGGSVPIVFMPAFMQKLSLLSPFRWAAMAIEGAAWRNTNWPDLAKPALVLTAIGVVGFVVGALALRARTRRA